MATEERVLDTCPRSIDVRHLSDADAPSSFKCLCFLTGTMAPRAFDNSGSFHVHRCGGLLMTRVVNCRLIGFWIRVTMKYILLCIFQKKPSCSNNPKLGIC